MSIDHLKFSPEILRRLGEELSPHPDQGVLELVRNSYDADAINCCISLENTERAGGTVIVQDDGTGMEADDITGGWLLIGKSGKIARRRTDLGRLTVGNKGLGRLAALRLGSEVDVHSLPKSDLSKEYSLTIDWSRYEAASTVEQVELEIKEKTPTLPNHGTKIIVRHLTKPFTADDVHRLARAVLLLSDPFDGATGFKPVLRAPEFKKLERLVREKYFAEADFHFVAELDKDGRASAKVMTSSNRVKWTASHEDIAGKQKPYECPSAVFELWIFLLKSDSFATKSFTMQEVRDWLGEYGGVHLYHRGLRVQPYGDPGHDWLDMNLARVRSPEDRPSTNNTIGRVIVEDIDEVLMQKTDRTGFVESPQFSEIRRFATDALEWLADQRIKESEKRRQKERTTARKGFKEAKASLTQVLEKVPKGARPVIQKALNEYEAARSREVRSLRAEVQLYRTLSTVGTTYAVFAHEVAAPGKRIRKLAESIERRAQRELGTQQYELNLKDPISSVMKAAEDLTSFPNLALKLLEKDKRKQERVKLHAVVSEVEMLVHPFAAMYRAKILPNLVDSNPEIFGSVAAVESILMNLITNALNAFSSWNGTRGERVVEVKTELQSDESVIVRVLDNGPGIKELSTEEIWLPGRTTSPDGTGLGLTIVRDSVADLGGKVTAIANGELGGAEFIIRLPLAAGRKDN
jgi:signal transduction histidine kinase